MKKALILVSALLIASVAGAQGKDKTPKEIECPVMKGHKVNIEKATKEKMFTDHKGRRYFFCCAGCPGAFKKNPDKYAKRPSIPTPKKKG